MTPEEQWTVENGERFRNILRNNGGHIEGAVMAAIRHAVLEERERWEKATRCLCAELPLKATVHFHGCPWEQDEIRQLHIRLKT